MADPYQVEPAKSNRSACKACKTKIDKGALRFGSLVPGFASDGSYHWRCITCITTKQAQNVVEKVGGFEGVGGFAGLDEDQQNEFREAFEKALPGEAPTAKAKAKAKEKAKAASGRAPPPEKKAPPPPRGLPPAKEQHEFLDAAKNRDFDKVREMIEEDKRFVNVQPAGRWSALHQAAEAGDEDAVKFLLENGASLTVENKEGQTPRDVADESVKHLFAPKRGSSGGDQPAAKKAKQGATALHLVEPTSAGDLAKRLSGSDGWPEPEDEESIVDEDLQHKALKDAPKAAKEVAQKLQKALNKANLPAGESDCKGEVIVIANPGDDTKEACLTALGIKKTAGETEVWEVAQLTDDKNYGDCKCFCWDDEDDVEEDDADYEKVQAATKVLAELDKHFEFNFGDEIVVAPVIYGGYASDGNIVGVLSMRVWT